MKRSNGRPGRHPFGGACHRAPFLLAAAAFALLACATAPVAAANIDLVVMVDTSESMFPYFDDLMNYLVQDLLTAKLHRGDTFHLLSFSGSPEVEISLEVNSDEAAQRAFGRILLLHALGRYTDLVSALQFLDKYTKELPETNPKQILLITDGVHDPPPGSPNRGSPESIRAAILEATQAMKKEGWTVDILKVPPQPAPGEENEKSYLPDIAQTLGVPVVPYMVGDKEHVTGRTTGFPNLAFPPNLGKVGNRFNAPFKVRNWKAEPIIVQLSAIQGDGLDLLEKKVSLTVPAMGEATLDAPLHLPLSFPRGDQSMQIRLVFQDDLRISPTAGTLSFTYTGKGGIPIPRLTLLYVLYILVGIALIYLLVRLFLFMRKKLLEAPVERNVRAAAGRPAAPGRRRKAGEAPAAHGTSRKLMPLLGEGTGHSAPAAIPARRVRPTVTSIRRTLPRQHMQEATLPALIEMRVGLQNHRIGFRNVHRISAGAARTIGGRFSSYLVFLVEVPSSIAEIRNVDGKYVFTALKPELFPSFTGPVEDCLEKEIPFLSPRGMELTLHFRQWVSPLDEINTLMRQAKGGAG
jgi:von Willebrand factor type A domain